MGYLWIITIILIIGLLFTSYYDHTQLISGFYMGNSNFLNDAELDSFILYISSDAGSAKSCYILAEKNKKLLINEPCTIHFKNYYINNFMNSLSCQCYNIEFCDLKCTEIPSNQQLIYYPKSGKLILTKDDTIYGIFHKDSSLSDLIFNDEKLTAPPIDKSMDIEVL